MANSRRFTQLASRLEKLRGHFLPAQFSPTGNYSEREYDMARAYLVLAHAEIEAYFEDRGRKIAQNANEIWQNKGRRTRILIRLLQHHHLKNKPWTRVEKTPDKIRSAYNSYLDAINKNHGVREENIFGILYPLGLQSRQVDNVWLTTIDSFGQSRGRVAHTSIKTQQPIDPANELQRITSQILPGLRRLDRKISRL